MPELVILGLMALLAIMLITSFFRSKRRLIINQPKALCIGRHKWRKLNEGAYNKVLSHIELNGQAYKVTQFWYRYICTKCGAISEEASTLEPELREEHA
jgi:hypothetical protein